MTSEKNKNRFQLNREAGLVLSVTHPSSTYWRISAKRSCLSTNLFCLPQSCALNDKMANWEQLCLGGYRRRVHHLQYGCVRGQFVRTVAQVPGHGDQYILFTLLFSDGGRQQLSRHPQLFLQYLHLLRILRKVPPSAALLRHLSLVSRRRDDIATERSEQLNFIQHRTINEIYYLYIINS